MSGEAKAIRRIPVRGPREAALEFLKISKDHGVIPQDCTGCVVLHLNKGGLVGTKLELTNPL
jgi:hypothetical protein